jgi:hypothetical protein
MDCSSNNGKYLLKVLIFWVLIQGIHDCACGHTEKPDSVNNVYYLSLKDKLTVYLYGNERFNQFDLKKSGHAYGISYKPNENFNIGFGFSYKWAGLSASASFKFLNDDDDKYGKTQSYGLNFEIYGKRLVWSGGLQTYKGYYWSNAGTFQDNGNVSSINTQRPDISTVSLSLGTFYSFNHKKFSFKAIFADNEWQRKSAGSLLAGSYISLFGISADSSLVPIPLKTSYQEFDSIKALNSFNLGNILGYTYTLIIKQHFYINAALMIGFSLQTIELFNLEGVSSLSDSKISSKLNVRFAIGYNSERCYYGLSFLDESYFINKDEQSQFSYNYGKFRLVYGRRF